MRKGAMNIDMLEEFVYLADTLSFKRAAEHFFVSKSVISRHIASLEEVLGVKLLERDARGARLTEAGREFHREARIILRDWEIAIERARAASSGGAMTVRIGYLRNAARPVIVRFVKYMAEKYPNLRIVLACMEYPELLRALVEHDVDVAVGINVDPAISRRYRSTRLYEDEFYAVCAHQHPLAKKASGASMDDLRKYKALLPDIYAYGDLAKHLDGLIDERDLLAARSYYRDIDMLYLMVQAEGYVAFSSGMNNEMFGDQLVQVPIEDMRTSISVCAFYHDSFTGSAFGACRDGFEWSANALASWDPALRYETFGQ